MHRKISSSEYYGDAEVLEHYGAGVGGGGGHDEGDDEAMMAMAEGSDYFNTNAGNGAYNSFAKKRLKPPRLTKNESIKMPPQMTLDIPWWGEYPILSIPFPVGSFSKEEVLQLYEELQSSGVPQIMSRFEEVVGNLCR